MPSARFKLRALALSSVASTVLSQLLALPAHADGQRYVLDWVPLEQLTPDQREALPYGSCGAYIAPTRNDADANLKPEGAPIRGEADYSSATENDQQQKHMLLVGDVVITQGYRQLKASRATVDQASNHLIAEGELELREPGLLIFGDKTLVDQNKETVVVDSATYVLHNQFVRGDAEQVTSNKQRMVLNKASITRCEPGNHTWKLKGSQIILNTEKRQGHAKHVKLFVKGVPLFYFPYLRFPLGDQRLSGFLAPAFSYDESEGLQFSLPYYFNLAPNYDFLYTPNYRERHGLLNKGLFRHLSHRFETEVTLGYLHRDRSKLDQDDQDLVDSGRITEEEAAPFKDEDRWLINVNQVGGRHRPWTTRIDYSKVSDIDYFRDFDTPSIADSDDVALDQKFSADYRFHHWTLGINTIQYQTLSSSATEPYKQLPGITASGNYALGNNWLAVLDHEWIRFEHDDSDNRNPLITGDRLRLKYQLDWSFEPEWGFFRPSARIKHLQYQLDDDNFRAGVDNTPSLSVPQLILDSGLFFERDGKGYLQTFEPRLFYFRSAFEDHSKLFDLTNDNRDIDFDTSQLGFSYSQLFRDTRFSGGDRIDDANQLTLGLTTRFIGNESGREWFSASIGQITYFDDRRVTLSNTPQTGNRSQKAAQLAANPLQYWRLSSDIIYNDFDREVEQGNIKIRYQNDLKHLVNLEYRFTRGASVDRHIQQVNLSVIAPLFSPQWNLLVHSEYDRTNTRELETLGALEYNGCCYRLRFGYRRELDNRLVNVIGSDELEYDQNIFLEIHFRGLGGPNNQLDPLLDESIDGYSEWQSIHHNN